MCSKEGSLRTAWPKEPSPTPVIFGQLENQLWKFWNWIGELAEIKRDLFERLEFVDGFSQAI